MHCNACGSLLQPDDKFCPGCGQAVVVAAPPLNSPPPAPMYVASGQPSGKATASLICGIFFFVIPAALCAIILGHIALSEIKRSGGRLIGEGRAIAGLVLGYMGLAAIPLILIIAAIAIPNLLRARMAANEASAVGSLRTIGNAEAAYAVRYPEVGFACKLSELGGRMGNASPEAAGLIDSRLASGMKSGYRFEITGCTAAAKTFNSYEVIARPFQPGSTGGRTFCSNQDGVIRYSFEKNGEACLDRGLPIE